MYEHYKLTCLSKSKVGELFVAFAQECGLNFSWLPKLLSFLSILNAVIPSRKQNLLKQSSYNTCMVFFLNANSKSLCKLVVFCPTGVIKTYIVGEMPMFLLFLGIYVLVYIIGIIVLIWSLSWEHWS